MKGDLANTTVAGIGKVSGEYSENLKKELENMKSGLDDILKYVMDMLKHRIQQQIDALEELKDAYGDIIDLRKEALDAAKEEAEYEDKVSEKAKQIAKLQERINALSLDDSRDAQAQKIKLEEEMAELLMECCRILAIVQVTHTVHKLQFCIGKAECSVCSLRGCKQKGIEILDSTLLKCRGTDRHSGVFERGEPKEL